ncbi:hypothetical protein DR095_00730 [Mycoplasma flocculare]|uniref:Uncharacterized protein n=2 Tax=Mesomycoplasma flocculare TaxID=2128 RepID=A0A0A8E6P5_MESFC|nr:hypothetical protein [Mesomycoplasma flocculare]MXR39292.1 hypothetical protein [Mycoplasma sp. MF12]AJC49663.1 hypothetical protein MYF_00420 [Mesomycoplasma flocculare ATCC 27399]ENX50875.1 hypothetical protein MFC_01465 [Mesomycoplasma flocculare ATCC 27716]MXR05706.1 hypothetical protein [Mesomycoplasma flocculare]MXR12076.1 hypothetical protein [Mesomycoplasma flocculare]
MAKFGKAQLEFIKMGLVESWVNQLDEEDFLVVYLHFKYDRKMNIPSIFNESTFIGPTERELISKIIYKDLYLDNQKQHFEAIACKLKRRKTDL